jgi:citrate lyase subunit gamma (acyl carrier protein)
MSSTPCAVAGTPRPSDILIKITSLDKEAETTINLESTVTAQFGSNILDVIRACLERAGIKSVHVDARDRGALECTIRARMEAAVARYREAK